MAVPELKPIEGKYEILEKLNEGGMGAVYKVQHRLLEEIRVIKVIRPQLQSDENLRRRFLREARAAVKLRHPNIAELYDFTVADDGTAYMVIEFIDGVDLVHLIEQSSLPPIGLVLDIGIQSLRALAYLHRKQFVHRDISPDNLMLTKDVEGQALIKLIDMGIAKPLESEMNLTGEGLFLGKVRYASPEQFGGQTGKEEIDHRSDLYSFGIVLYELLTGAHPITGEDNQTILAGHLFHPPRSFAETDPQDHVPEELRAVVMQALEKNADGRFPDADSFSNALLTLRTQLEESEPETSSLDATVIQPMPGRSTGRPGSTQDRLDLEFAPGRTPAPRPLEPVPPSDQDLQESLLQASCDKVEALIEAKRLLEAEVEVQRAEKTLGSSILLSEFNQRLKKLRGKVNESIVRARILQREGELEEALERLDEATEIDSESPEITTLQEEIRQALGRRRQEIESARQAIEVQLEAGQLDEAQRGLEKAKESLGRFAELEDLQQRVDSLTKAAAQVREVAEAAGKIGKLIENGELHQATAALAAAQKTLGDDEMFRELAEQIRSRQAQERQRQELAEEAERKRQINSFLEMAQRHIEAENFEAALEQLDQAARLDPEDPKIQALVNRTRESMERRERLQQRAAELQELTLEVDGLLETRDLDGAEQVVTQGEARYGTLPELTSLRARIDEARLEKRDKAAGESLKKAYRLFETGNLDGAAESVDQALTLSPGHPQAAKLQQKIDERRREESRLRALESARSTILGHLNSGSLEQAEAVLQSSIGELGAGRELRDLQERLHELRSRQERRAQIDQQAQQIEKLIQKNRLDKASTALADAMRSLGQDRVFDELRTRVEEKAGSEQAAQEILAAEHGKKPSSPRTKAILAAAAALVLIVAVVLYSTRSRPASTTAGGPLEQTVLAEPQETLDDILLGQDLGSFHALVIGNNEYEQGLPNLDTAVNDAQQVADSLRDRYGFETRLLLNSSRYETLSALEEYIRNLGADDNLLVFYAGHGFVDEVTGRGYWQPVDAEPDNTANWISSLEVSDILLDVPARRVLVVADSCFSGAFAGSAEPTPAQSAGEAAREEVLERLDLRTRRVLASGSLQPVLDNGVDGHSVFSRALLAVLESDSGAMESSDLFETLRERVAADMAGMELQQQPQFGPLDSDGGGLFLFVPDTDGRG